MISTKIIVTGQAEGVVLKLQAPLSFWGGVNPKTGVIIQADHPDRGTSITNTILALPGLIGSSSSSAVLLELLYKDSARRFGCKRNGVPNDFYSTNADRFVCNRTNRCH